MRVDCLRRWVAGAAAIGCAAALLAGCAAGRAQGRFDGAAAPFGERDARDIDSDLRDSGPAGGSGNEPALRHHVLNRIGYGPDPWSSARIAELGIAGYVKEQLRPETIDDSALEARLALLPGLNLNHVELRHEYSKGGNSGPIEALRQLQIAKLTRGVLSRRQLEQVLFDFWFNHFNVDGSNGRPKWDVIPYDRWTLRPRVLGKFEDLLLAVARSPAMGDYLDNRRSKVGKINENFGREILELYTLGVDGGYDEHDVVEVSRCFTGWSDLLARDDGFKFRARWHDDGEKTMFDGTLRIPPGGGEQDGIDVIGYLAAHPSTAAFLSRKLVKRFVNERPPEALVAAAAETYLATGGEIRAVMETILLSPEFLRDPAHRGNKVKRPHHLLISAARALGADPTQINYRRLRRNSDDMGEGLFEAGPPTGYPDESAFWTSPGTIVTRFNELERRARGADGFDFSYPVSAGTAEEIVDALIATLLPGGASSDTRDIAIALAEGLSVSDRSKIQQTAAFLMSSPEFLQH